jgi:hypothetical protein
VPPDIFVRGYRESGCDYRGGVVVWLLHALGLVCHLRQVTLGISSKRPLVRGLAPRECVSSEDGFGHIQIGRIECKAAASPGSGLLVQDRLDESMLNTLPLTDGVADDLAHLKVGDVADGLKHVIVHVDT